MPDIIKIYECTRPVRNIDKRHLSLEIEIEITTVPNKLRNLNIEVKPNFHKADNDAIKLQLSKSDWNYLFKRCVDVNGIVKISYEHLDRIVKEF